MGGMRLTLVSRSNRNSRRGAALVETALTLPVFLLFLAAIGEFGHFYLITHVLNSAARRGAHWGSFEGASNAEVTSKIKQVLGAAFDENQATILIRDGSVFDEPNVNPSAINYAALPSIDLSTAEMGDCFIVQIQVPYNNVSLLPPFFVNGATITGRAVMRHE
jgi:Flp pilus assembly protein TadG